MTALAKYGKDLLAAAPGDDSGFAPPTSLWRIELQASGETASYSQVLPTNSVTVAYAGAIAPYGDFDFDTVTDLVVAVPNGFDVLLYDRGVREARTYRGYPGDELPRRQVNAAALAVLPDIDGNLMPEVVLGAPGGAGEVLLVRLNGESAAGASCGDPTGNGEVTAADALYVLKAAVGLRFCDQLYCDVDASGRITATDALAVLRNSVTSESLLACPTTTTTTSSTIIVADECFEDSDCADFPFQLVHCCGYSCCECDNDDSQCPVGSSCVAQACIPTP